MARPFRACLGALLAGSSLWAGPPYLTDDPEPVGVRHWEVYLFTQGQSGGGARSGLGPALEANYGPFEGAQLQVQVPLAYGDGDEGRHRGLGDLQAGFKFRFLEEGAWRPQVAVYPQVQAPTGREGAGLGAGHWKILLPLWLQKGAGPWTLCGGGGWWRNPGEGRHDHGQFGCLLRRDLAEGISVGLECFHQASPGLGVPAATAFNVGLEGALGGRLQAVGSLGRTFRGPGGAQFYLGLRGSL